MPLHCKALVGTLLSLAGLISVHATARTEDRITEISLEMVEGRTSEDKAFGAGFKIVLSSDGTALFVGKSGVKLIGRYKGVITKDEFERLAQFIESRRYMKIKEKQSISSRPEMPAGGERVYSTQSPVVITVIRRGNNQKRIERRTFVRPPDNEKSVPKELMEIEKAITDAAMRIIWEKLDDK